MKNEEEFKAYKTNGGGACIAAASNTQECTWSGCGSHLGAFSMHINGSDRWKHVGIEDITGHSCNSWRLALPWLLLVFLFFPTSIRSSNPTVFTLFLFCLSFCCSKFFPNCSFSFSFFTFLVALEKSDVLAISSISCVVCSKSIHKYIYIPILTLYSSKSEFIYKAFLYSPNSHSKRILLILILMI